MNDAPEGPGGAAAVGWLAGGLAVAAGGYVLGVAPAWSLPDPLRGELGWPLSWVALHGTALGAGLLAVGALTIFDGLRSRVTWTRWRTSLTLASLAGVTLAVASQGQSLALTPAVGAQPQRVSSPPRPGPAPAQEPAAPREPVEALLARLDSRNGPKNLGIVDSLIKHGLGAVPALRTHVLTPNAGGRPYAVYALAQILHREEPVAEGLEALLGCLDPEAPSAVRAQAATGLTLLADPRTAEHMVALYRGDSELREALCAISGERFADRAAAASWWVTHRDDFPPQLRGGDLDGAPADTTQDQIGLLLSLLRDSGDAVTNQQVVGELRGLGGAVIPGLIDLAERRVDGSGWAAQALARVLQDLPPAERPLGALEVLVACVNAEADYVLQAQALEGLYELADPRTVQALLVHLDHPRSAVRLLCQSVCERITGQAFVDRAAGEAWWRQHADALGPQVGVAPR